MKITFLGTGTSQGVPVIACKCKVCLSKNLKDKRLRSSILIELHNKTIVIDTGPDFRQQMLRENVEKLDAVLYTHSHADHVHGIDDLRAFCWQRKDNKPIPIYGDEYTMNQLKNRFNYAFQANLGPAIPSLKANNIEIGNNIIEDINIQVIKQIHGKGYSLGYRFNNIAYSTDVNKFPDGSLKQLENLDLWIVDCVRYEAHYSHSHFDQTMDWIRQLKPKRAILTHMGHWLDYKELKARCPHNVEPGIDGMVIHA